MTEKLASISEVVAFHKFPPGDATFGAAVKQWRLQRREMSGIDFLYQENLDCKEPQISQPRDKNITSGKIERKAKKALIMSAANLVADDLGYETLRVV